MFFYQAIDFLIIYFLLLGDLKNPILTKISNFFLIFIFFSVTGLSYKIHNDMYVYQFLYEHMNLSWIGKINLEPGYILTSVFFSNFLSFPLFKMLVYAVCTILIYKGLIAFVSRKDAAFIMALLYIIAPFYLIYESAFRQAITISIFIFSLQYLKEKKYIKYIVIILLAATFHISALLLLILPLFYKWHKRTFFFDISLISIIMVMGILPIFSSIIAIAINELAKYIPRLNSYTDTLINNNISFSLFLLLNVAIIISLIVLFYTKKNTATIEEKFIYTSSLIFFIIYFIGLHISIFYRILPYFYVFFGFAIILLFRRIPQTSFYFILKYAIVLVFIFKLNLPIILKGNMKDFRYIPYHSYIETVFYDIPYEDTAQYLHMFSRYGRSELDENHFLREGK